MRLLLFSFGPGTERTVKYLCRFSLVHLTFGNMKDRQAADPSCPEDILGQTFSGGRYLGKNYW